MNHPLAQDWLNKLQDSGYRLTAPRRAIVELLAASAHAMGPLELFDEGRRGYHGLGLVTVYRTLEKLEELGLIQRVHQPGGCNMYLRANQGHEHLLVCTACGRVEFFSGDDLHTLFEGLAQRSGYQIGEHWLQLHGLCPTCRPAAA
jgi:Fur family ferric uptake transcriptional regulator